MTAAILAFAVTAPTEADEAMVQPPVGAVLVLEVVAKGVQIYLAPVAYIRRSATSGGIAPSSGCDSNHAGADARVRYGAIYQFYAESK
jgi:hypothetical protein